MGRLAPTHPISRYGDEGIRDRIDVMGEHLIWTGHMCRGGSRNKSWHRKYASHDMGGETGIKVARVIYGIMTGVDLTDDEVLWHKPSCIHERCVQPKCLEKITKQEAMRRCGRMKKSQRRLPANDMDISLPQPQNTDAAVSVEKKVS